MKFLSALAILFLSISTNGSTLTEVPCRNQSLLNSSPDPSWSDASFWNLCGQSWIFKFHERLKVLAPHDPLAEMALKIAGDAMVLSSSLVEVTSDYYDMETTEWRRMSGIGTVIVTGTDGPLKPTRASGMRDQLMAGRFFVLTAAHVAGGENLKVLRIKGAELSIKSVYHDSENDLTLIELAKDKIDLLPFPLAHFVLGPEGPYLQIYFGDLQDKTWLEDEVSGQFFQVTRIESLSGIFFTGGAESSIITPVWMNMPEAKNSIAKPDSISRGLKSTHHELPFALYTGLSGSPIAVAYPIPDGKYNYFLRPYFYMLGGVLTASSDDEKKSSGAAAYPINALVNKALKSMGAHFDNNPGWFQFDHFFGKIQDHISLYLKMGPIGNGIVVNGYTGNQSPLSAKLKEKGIPTEQIQKSKQKFSKVQAGLTQEEKAKETIRRLNALIQEKIEVEIK